MRGGEKFSATFVEQFLLRLTNMTKETSNQKPIVNDARSQSKLLDEQNPESEPNFQPVHFLFLANFKTCQSFCRNLQSVTFQKVRSADPKTFSPTPDTPQTTNRSAVPFDA